MNLNEWAQRWGVPYAALEDLRRMMRADPGPPAAIGGRSEAAVQNDLRLAVSRRGGRLWRNNVGAFKDENGNFVRYGLANDSRQMNDVLKSSDLVGLRPVTIEPQHIGHTFGLFLAREVKPEGWRFTGTPREEAQRNFIELVLSLGGDAAFSTGEI